MVHLRRYFWLSYGPIALFISSVVIWMICACGSTPSGPDSLTGPSASDGLCMVIWLFNIVLWPLAGWVLLPFQQAKFFHDFLDSGFRPALYVLSAIVLFWALCLFQKDNDGGIDIDSFPIIALLTVPPNFLMARIVQYLVEMSTNKS